MKKFILAAVAAICFAAPVAASEAVDIPEHDWSFFGVFGKWDRQQLQRGFQVYREVCSSCHSLQYVAFRDLTQLGYSEAQAKALAEEAQYDVIDDEGSVVQRKGLTSDYLPKPYPNEQFARASNNGALPPDLSLIAKSRDGGRHYTGPDYITALMLGYEDPPAGVTVPDGMVYNKYFADGTFLIAMPQQLTEGRVEYGDGTANTPEQMAKDVSAFLMWTAEPKMEIRHATGVRVFLFTLFFTVLAFLLKRRIWARLDH